MKWGYWILTGLSSGVALFAVLDARKKGKIIKGAFLNSRLVSETFSDEQFDIEIEKFKERSMLVYREMFP